MKRIFSILLLTILSTCAFAQRASDSTIVLQIRKQLKSNNCTAAFDLSNKLSLDYKDKVDYSRLMGEVHECLGNYALSIEFYNKYLKNYSGNDSVRKRIDKLDSIVSVKAKKEEAYELKTGKKRTNYSSSGRFMEFHYGFSMYLSDPDKSPHRIGHSISNVFTTSKHDSKWIWKFGLGLHYFTAHNNTFYAKLSNTADSLANVHGSIGLEAKEMLLRPVFRDKINSVSVGATVGARFIIPTRYQIGHVGPDYTKSFKGFVTSTVGITSQYQHKNMIATIDIFTYLRPSFKVNVDIDKTTTVPMSNIGVTISIGYRVEDFYYKIFKV